METCYIVGAGDFTSRDFAPTKNDFVIAADGGYMALEAIGHQPDLLLGDFDSLGDLEQIPTGIAIDRYAVEKDDTDMGLALARAWEMGYRDFSIYGGGGGRVDHLIANIQTMCKYSRLGGSLRLIDPAYDVFVLTNGSLTLPLRQKHCLVSVFCHGETAEGVTLRGLQYPLDRHMLTCDYPLGVSNQVMDEHIPAVVTVENGTVYIISYTEPSIH
ncbi:MAG: thiamine diphosphokinase [Clostridiales bacterium]|nr:thiamine diphosphokinase [Clostridiales bacterium]